MTTSNDFEILDWYQYMPYQMIERFNTSGILGAKFCNTHLCNLPDPSMDTELRGTTKAPSTAFPTTTVTLVGWSGFTWPITKGPVTENWKISAQRFKIGSENVQNNEVKQGKNNSIKYCPERYLLLLSLLAMH